MQLVADRGRGKGVVIAEGAGHFIQRDTPEVVAREIVELIEKVEGRK
jgi:pimeloyl-ACP methyl ester carboxylesterase